MSQIPVVILLLFLVYRDMFGHSKEDPDSGPKGGSLEMQAENQMSVDGLTGSRTVNQDRRDAEDRPQVSRKQMIMVTGCAAGLCFIYDGLQVRTSSNGGIINSQPGVNFSVSEGVGR